MKTVATFLLFSFVWVSCKPGSLAKHPESCKEFCISKNNHNASMIIENRLCHTMYMDAIREGAKKGYCDDGSLTNFKGSKPKDPEPVLCKALKDRSQEKCKKMPGNPSRMNQQVSRSAMYKGGKLYSVDGELVNKCDCTQWQKDKPSNVSAQNHLRPPGLQGIP